jgi:hypothetical protein
MEEKKKRRKSSDNEGRRSTPRSGHDAAEKSKNEAQQMLVRESPDPWALVRIHGSAQVQVLFIHGGH